MEPFKTHSSSSRMTVYLSSFSDRLLFDNLKFILDGLQVQRNLTGVLKKGTGNACQPGPNGILNANLDKRTKLVERKLEKYSEAPITKNIKIKPVPSSFSTKKMELFHWSGELLTAPRYICKT